MASHSGVHALCPTSRNLTDAQLDATVPAALFDAAGLPRLVSALEAGGFTPDDLELLCWGNWRRVLAAWWR